MLSSKSSQNGSILSMPSGDSHRSRNMTKSLKIDSDDPVSGGVLDLPPGRIIEPQADIAHRAAVADFFKFLR